MPTHLLATAAACEAERLSSIGIVRGEEPEYPSETLAQCAILGMKLVFSSRDDYRQKKIPPEIDPSDYLVINEGGYGPRGAEGASHILDGHAGNYNHICCAVGTGTTFAGLINAPGKRKLTGISVMKNNHSLDSEVLSLITKTGNHWELIHDYHFGGYAKYTRELINFMNELYRQSNIPSDIVYTGKLFFAINDLVKRNYFEKGSRILIIHSGGLPGNNSLEKGTLIY